MRHFSKLVHLIGVPPYYTNIAGGKWCFSRAKYTKVEGLKGTHRFPVTMIFAPKPAGVIAKILLLIVKLVLLH